MRTLLLAGSLLLATSGRAPAVLIVDFSPDAVEGTPGNPFKHELVWKPDHGGLLRHQLHRDNYRRLDLLQFGGRSGR